MPTTAAEMDASKAFYEGEVMWPQQVGAAKEEFQKLLEKKSEPQLSEVEQALKVHKEVVDIRDVARSVVTYIEETYGETGQSSEQGEKQKEKKTKARKNPKKRRRRRTGKRK